MRFRYGEQVEAGERGVWKRALPPGKYALNPYALRVELVPTVNFVLRWITGQVEAHQYDKDLTSLDLITADGYEPMLPLSLVLHIDYEKAPSRHPALRRREDGSSARRWTRSSPPTSATSRRARACSTC